MSGSANSRFRSQSYNDRKFAICSVCLNLAAMVLKLPFPLTLVILSYSSRSLVEIYTIIKIVGTVCNIDNGFSFFINMLVNTPFYDEFLRLFGFRKLTSIDININNRRLNSSLKSISKPVLAKPK